MRRVLPHISVAVAAACVIAGSCAASAQARDDAPCTNAVANVPTQLCPLAELLDGTRVPVHTQPVRHNKGTPRPLARSTAHAQDTTMGKALSFECQAKGALYWHPNNRTFNIWWARTIGEDGRPGWVPEVFFKGGANNEPDLRLRRCQSPAPPPPPNPCDPAPALAGVTMRTRFKGDRRDRTVRYRSHPTVRGRLTDPSGAPIAGAPTCVGVQDTADGPVTAIGSIATDADGRYEFKLPTGASRRVWFVYRTAAGAAADYVDALVRAPVTMRASRRSLRNGQSTLFRGRVGGRADREGLIVQLQYPTGRGHWETFATTSVSAKGRFSYPYRFTRTVGTHTYRVRARVPEQRGWPFVAGASKRLRVRVRG
jgi:hypothetical protein